MKTLNTRTGLAALSVTLMLALSACGGGAQAAGESSEAATNAPAATASASASAASTPTTAKASASASATVAANPKGSEVIEIRAADDTNADATIAKEAAMKAAKRVAINENRLVNAWLHGDFEHTSDEELLKFVEPGTLDQVKETIQASRDAVEGNGGAFTGEVTIRDIQVSEVLSSKYQDGSSHPYSYLKVTYCADWTQVHTPDGKRAIVGKDSTSTAEVLVIRLQDGRYMYAGARQLNSGCASS